jgi:ankyrin repeat protein
MISKGANINIPIDDGQVGAFVEICKRWKDDIELLELCLTAPNDGVNKENMEMNQTPGGLRPIHYISSLWTTVQSLKLMKQYGADLTSQTTMGVTPLMYCIHDRYDHVEHDYDVGLDSITYLIEQHVPLEMTDNKENTALHYLCVIRIHNMSGLQLFVNAGANVNAKNRDGTSPLHHIAHNWKNNIDALRFMVDHGADLNAALNKGRTVLQLLNSHWTNKSYMELFTE